MIRYEMTFSESGEESTPYVIEITRKPSHEAGLKGFMKGMSSAGGKFGMQDAMQLGGALSSAAAMFGQNQQPTIMGAGQGRGRMVGQYSQRRRIA